MDGRSAGLLRLGAIASGLAGLFALAGCGGDVTAGSPARAAEAPRQPATDAVSAEQAPVIARPQDGAVLRGTRAATASAPSRVTVRVRGYAGPAQPVVVAGSCLRRPCQVPARTDSGGRFVVTLRLRVERSVRRVRIAVRPAAARAAADEITVRLRFTPRVRDTDPTGAVKAPSPPASTTPPPASTTPPPAAVTPGPAPVPGAPEAVLVIGDSLAQGMASALPAQLPGWSVRTDARRSRPLASGLEVLRAVAAPPRILAFSLFTNNRPTDVGSLEAAVGESITRAGPSGCVVWATIRRPRVGGRTYAAVNAMLERLAVAPALAGRLLLVPWARETAAHPEWMRRDRVHATMEGYAQRARLYAEAIARCAAAGT